MRRAANILVSSITAASVFATALLATRAPAADATVAASQLSPTHVDPQHRSPGPQVPALFGEELQMPDTLGVGRVTPNVREHLPEVQAMADYLGASLAGDGIARSRPVIARDNAEMIDFLRRGVADVVSETPLSAMRFVEETGAEILLCERKNGVAEYRSLIFVRADSDVATLADLRGKRVAFEDRGSTSAFLLPLATMKAAGLRTVELSDTRAGVEPDAVGYFFALSERPLSETVRGRVADAGAFSDLDWQELQRSDPAAAGGLRVIAETERVPRSFLLTGPAMKPELKQALKKTLLAMHENDAGRAVLDEYSKVERYDDIDETLATSIDRVRELYRLVHTEAAHDQAAPGQAK